MTPFSLPVTEQTPLPHHFPEALSAHVRRFAREAALEAFATRCTKPRGALPRRSYLPARQGGGKFTSHLPPKTVRRRIDAGDLPATRLRRDWRIALGPQGACNSSWQLRHR